jgi:hypothetical protein
MPIATQCKAHGCETLTVGPFCVEHEARVTRVFVRGRPWSPGNASSLGSSSTAVAMTPVVRNARRAWARREAARAHR